MLDAEVKQLSSSGSGDLGAGIAVLDDDGKSDLGFIRWSKADKPASPIIGDISVIFGGSCFSGESQSGLVKFAHTVSGAPALMDNGLHGRDNEFDVFGVDFEVY